MSTLSENTEQLTAGGDLQERAAAEDGLRGRPRAKRDQREELHRGHQPPWCLLLPAGAELVTCAMEEKVTNTFSIFSPFRRCCYNKRLLQHGGQ